MTDEIEKKIKDILQTQAKKLNKQSDKDRVWTEKIFKALSKLGYDRNFGVSASGGDAEDREWLYDLVWYDLDNNQRLTKLPLVLESEWNFR